MGTQMERKWRKTIKIYRYLLEAVKLKPHHHMSSQIFKFLAQSYHVSEAAKQNIE